LSVVGGSERKQEREQRQQRACHEHLRAEDAIEETAGEQADDARDSTMLKPTVPTKSAARIGYIEGREALAAWLVCRMPASYSTHGRPPYGAPRTREFAYSNDFHVCCTRHRHSPDTNGAVV